MSELALLTDEEVFSLIESITEEWKPFDEITAPYAPSFDNREKVSGVRSFYRVAVAQMLPAFEGSVGCDLGCWLGFTGLVLSSLGARRVYGIEIQTDFVDVAESWRSARALDELRYREMRPGIVPLQSESIDWVLVNQVLCNALPDTFSASLKEAYRILRPGGVLVLSDSNNPYCPLTLERLARTYRDREYGDGSPSEPNGIEYRTRCAMIRKLDAAISANGVSAIARNTCYMWGNSIVDAVRDFQVDGRLPDSPFEPGSQKVICCPITGAARGNITDPYALCREVEMLGFRAHITVNPSWQRVDNDALHQQLRNSQGFFIYGVKCETSAPMVDRTLSRANRWRARLSRLTGLNS